LNSLINIDQNNPPKNELIHWDNYLDRARKMISKKASRKSFTTNMVELFSEQEIFEAMILLLEDFYHKTNSDDLGAFLGDLLHPDYGETADDAAWEEWQECLHRVKNSKK